VISAEGGGVEAVGGFARCVCSSPDGDFAWSPDGSEIAFAAEHGARANPKRAGIAFVRPDGTVVTRFDTGAAGNLRWSPDGARLAWAGDNDGHLHVASADGKGMRTIAADARFYDMSPSWSPDSRSIAFVRCGQECDSIFGDVYITSLDGSAPVRATRDGRNAEPSFSPDGQRLAFVRAFGRHQDRFRIVVADIDGKHLHVVGSGFGQSLSPVWSPRGDTIVYLGDYRDRGVTTGPELREVSPDGADDHPLARAFEALRRTGSEVSVSWSPGGDWIAFEHLSNREGDGNGGIYVVRADGSGLRQLTREP